MTETVYDTLGHTNVANLQPQKSAYDVRYEHIMKISSCFSLLSSLKVSSSASNTAAANEIDRTDASRVSVSQ